MKTGSAALAFLVLCVFCVRAFVVEVNDKGDPLRWHLSPPEPPVPPNPAEQGVHTNVVNPVTKAVRFYLAAGAYSASNTAAELNAVFLQLNIVWMEPAAVQAAFESGNHA